MRARLQAGLTLLLLAIPPAAHAQDGALCDAAIRSAERAARTPAALLGAIGIVESGRVDQTTRRVSPWPWTINVEGRGYMFETRAQAVAAVLAARAEGRRSIDVGCMQVNLMHHPTAFATLEDAFDPSTNATYAAGFLVRLRAQTGDWSSAAAAYHSQTPDLGQGYLQRVMTVLGVPMPPSRLAAPAIRREPAGGYTPEFRARLLQDAADDRALRQRMGLRLPAAPRPAARRT